MSVLRDGLPYWAWFGLATLLALGALLAVVFAVMPRRFVLEPGLREQDLNFPARAPAFDAPVPAALTRPARPPAPSPVPAAPSVGPAERLWTAVDSLRSEGREAEALEELRRHLERRPGAHDVRLEYARSLERVGRPGAAEAALERVAAATGSLPSRLALARLRWRRGDRGGALEIYDRLVAERPGDEALALERAGLLASAGRFGEAVAAHRALAEAAGPGETAPRRLALARALYWDRRHEAALRAARAVPAGTPEARAAAALAARIRSEHPLPATEPVDGSPLARARAAAAAGDPREAERRYRAALRLAPGHETARRELAELLATRLDAPAEAARVLEARPGGAGPGSDPEVRRRLARYHAWAGNGAAARRVLEGLAADGEAGADGLALLGDLLRWDGEASAAEARYRAALAREPGHPGARRGLDALREAAEVRVAARDPRRAGLEADLYADSDDFLSRGVLGRAVTGWDTHRLELAAGHRWIRGSGAGGALEEEAGAVGEAAWVGWWRHAGVRTELRVGVERFDATGAEPFLAASVELPDAGVRAAYGHGLAHATTLTLSSLRDQTRLDRAEASLWRPLGGGDWTLRVAGEAASVRGGGVENGRWVGEAELTRAIALGGDLRLGLASRVLTTSGPAPAAPGGGAAYWAPALSWTQAAGVSVDRPLSGAEDGWGWRARLQPGVGWVRLHGQAGTELEPRLFGEAGLTWRRDDATVGADLRYLRSRLDGYEALGATLGVDVRF